MPKPFLTIFTPTYNRAHTLPRLYESLIIQSEKNFEWMIVDDGSTDDTEKLIQSYIEENKISIHYFKQKNQGKHIAINTALNLINTPFFVTIDSDDYISKECINICRDLSDEINNSEDFAGFSFIHFSDKTPYEPHKYGHKKWTDFQSYKWEFKGEMIFTFKTEIAKKFPFPVFENEKFCQEAVVLLRILKHYKILFTDHVLAFGDYLEDGLSQNIYKRLLANPRYALLSIKEKLNFPNYNGDRKVLIHNYWDIASKAKHIPWSEKLRGIPIPWILEFIKIKLSVYKNK